MLPPDFEMELFEDKVGQMTDTAITQGFRDELFEFQTGTAFYIAGSDVPDTDLTDTGSGGVCPGRLCAERARLGRPCGNRA